MNRASLFTLVAIGFLANSLGCEIIAQVDRSKIEDVGGVGGAPTSTVSSSSTGGTGGSPCVPVDDSNACTTDVCENGVPAHTPTAAGTACTTGGTLCDGKGACVECLAVSDCAGTDDACQTRTCTAGKCGHDFAAAGTALPTQTTGDCKQNECDGVGATVVQPLATDLPDDKNACTDDVCTAGVPTNPPKAKGTSCGAALVCDDVGTCLGCNTGADCPGTDDECKTRTCTVGVCGMAFTAANTPVLEQTALNCLKATCDGTGNIANIIDNTDLPVDDSNPCTDEVCTAGVPAHPAKANGFTCTDGNACTVADTCQAGVCTSGTPVTCAAQDQCHTAGTCNTTTGVCSNPTKADGSTCADGNACTQTDTCQAGTCTGASPVVCAAPDQCHTAGTCNTTTGVCSNPAKADGSTCADGNACTQTDTCQAGICTGASPVTCTAQDQCHTAGTCDTTTGACSSPSKADGSACTDSNACTQTETCQAGTCTGVSPCVHGTCSDGTTSYTCACAAGYEGTNCETPIVVTPCAPNPCNGGICAVVGASYTCDCTGRPYQGVNCAEICPCSDLSVIVSQYDTPYQQVLAFGVQSNAAVTVATTSWGMGAVVVGQGGFGYTGTVAAFVNTQQHTCGIFQPDIGPYGFYQGYDYHTGLTAGQELSCEVGLQRDAQQTSLSVTSSPASADGCAPNPCGAGICYNLANTSGGYRCH